MGYNVLSSLIKGLPDMKGHLLCVKIVRENHDKNFLRQTRGNKQISASFRIPQDPSFYNEGRGYPKNITTSSRTVLKAPLEGTPARSLRHRYREAIGILNKDES